MDISRFLEAARQGCVDPLHAARYHGGKGSAPDYRGAAEATANSQRVNQVTPYGSLTWSRRSDAHPWTQYVDLDPRAQQTLDTQMDLSNQVADVASGQIGQVRQQYGQPMDLSSVPQIADRAYGAFTSRLDPQWDMRRDQEETRLRNQGLVPGGEAYDNAMRTFNEGRNDAYQQANLAAIQTMPQTYQLASSTYNQPLNTLNALRTGAQVQNPQFTPSSQMPATNYLGAAQQQGQYDTQQRNAMLSGLFGLGSAAILGGGIPGIPGLGAAGAGLAV